MLRSSDTSKKGHCKVPDPSNTVFYTVSADIKSFDDNMVQSQEQQLTAQYWTKRNVGYDCQPAVCSEWSNCLGRATAHSRTTAYMRSTDNALTGKLCMYCCKFCIPS